MRFRLIWTIFKKEITETLRDRRTLLMMIGLPLLLYPTLMIGLTRLQESRIEAQQAKASNITVWGDAPKDLIQWLERTNLFTVSRGIGISETVSNGLASGTLQPPAPEASIRKAKGRSPGAGADTNSPVFQAAQDLVAKRRIDAVLVVWPGFQQALAEHRIGTVSIYYDSVREESGMAQGRLQDQLNDYRVQQILRRERERGLAEGFSTAIKIQQSNVSSAVRRVGQAIGSVLPFLLIIMSASGGLYAAIDLTAGEKERNTMQTLLCAPVEYTEIIGGKFLAAWCIVLITTMANVASLAATFARIVAPMGAISIPPSTYVLTFFVLLPATFTVTAIFLAVAVFAKDYKDGQNFLTPVFIGLTLPLAATLLPGVELNAWTSFVPIVNIALLIKAMFLAEAQLNMVFLTLASSAAYAVMTLMFAARIFYREQVLLGGRETVRDILRFDPPRDGYPTPAVSLTTFALVFVLVFYGSLLLTENEIIGTVLITQFGFFLIPLVVLAHILKLDVKRTFSFRALPGWKTFAGAVLIALSGWAVTGGIVVRLLPPPDTFVKAMEEVLQLRDPSLPAWVLVLVLGVTPGVCEELFFRGMIMSGFRRLGMWPAILLTAFLFGIAHSSIYRLLPTFSLGVVLGWAAWRSGSIACSILIHAINNSLLVSVVKYPQLAKLLHTESSDLQFLPWDITIAGTVVMVLGIILIRLDSPHASAVPSVNPSS